MKKPRRSTGRLLPVLVLTLAVLVCLGLYWNQPQLRAERFVAAHGAELEEALEGDGGIPARIGYETCNLWGQDGEMAEFILSAWGTPTTAATGPAGTCPWPSRAWTCP